ncbi:hypothetical protein LVJ94_28265 [Pendulispora rubella]|uniref:PrgI family protein n=1 Tax=Pendulispora rubella TaxID=2741070 RepID=A0ABZ2KQ83_9BACT
MNRYLVTAGGRHVASRLAPGLMTAGVFIVPFVVAFIVGCIAGLLHSTALGILAAVLWLLLLLTGPGVIFWSLARAKSQLSQGNAAWLRGDSLTSVRCAHFVLTWIFRSDLRTGALHLLGLTAEADGEFALAYELFSLAKDMTPAAISSRLRGKLHATLEAHTALTAAALGRADLAQAAIARGWYQVQLAQLPPGALDFFLDDSALPVPKFISVASNIDIVETRRDPRGLLFLAGTVAAFRNDERKVAAEVGARMHEWLGTLLPREALLFRVTMGRALAEVAGPHRALPAPSLEGDPMRAWIERALGF